MPNKPWYQSKTVWAGIAGTLRGIYLLLQVALPLFTNIQLPPIPPTADGFMALIFGGTTVYGRVTASTTISTPSTNAPPQ